MKDRTIAVALSLAALAVYACALPVSYAFWDTGELQVVSIVLGIEHPPGDPAFVLLGWLVSHALPFGDPAWRVNFMSSGFVAISIGLLYATARALGVPRIVAAVCAFGFAFAPQTLVYATRAEGHDLVLCFSACALYFGARYDGTRSVRDLFLTALSFGLLAATHGVALFFFPALAVLVALRPPPPQRRRAAAAAVAAGIVIGLSPYAYIVPRSAYLYAHRIDPTLALGIPPGAPFWDYDHPSGSLQNFWGFLTGADFHVHSGFAGYLRCDQYLSYALGFEKRISTAFGFAGTLLAALGAGFLVFRRGGIGKAIVIAALFAVPYTESYADLQDPDRYYLLAQWCAAIAIGLAFDGIANLVWRKPPAIVAAFFALTLAVVFAGASGTRAEIFRQREDDTAPQYVAYIRSVTPDNAIVLAEWAYSSPLAYASFVDRDFGHRIAVSAGPRQYIAYYPTWLRESRPLYAVSFDDDLKLPGYDVSRVSFDKSFYVYEIRR